MSVYTNMTYVSLKWHFSNEVFLLLFLLTPIMGGLDPGLCTWSVKASVTWLHPQLPGWARWWAEVLRLNMTEWRQWIVRFIQWPEPWITTVSLLIRKVNMVAHIAFYDCDLFPNTLCWLLLTLLLPFRLWNLLFFFHSQLTGSVGPQKGHFSVLITPELSYLHLCLYPLASLSCCRRIISGPGKCTQPAPCFRT